MKADDAKIALVKLSVRKKRGEGPNNINPTSEEGKGGENEDSKAERQRKHRSRVACAFIKFVSPTSKPRRR